MSWAAYKERVWEGECSTWRETQQYSLPYLDELPERETSSCYFTAGFVMTTILSMVIGITLFIFHRKSMTISLLPTNSSGLHGYLSTPLPT